MLLNILFYIYIGVFVIFFFGFCIFIHELGHFLAAKWRKLHIVAFSIGFKKIWGWKRNGIEYRIGCLPFGGYVDLPQLEPNPSLKDELGNSVKLAPIKPSDRMIVAFAGPFFNILFGFFLGLVLWIFGIPQTTPLMDSIKVASLISDSPEYKAGLREGDNIIKINGSSFYESWEQVVQRIIFTIGNVSLTVQDGNSSRDVVYKPQINKFGNPALAKEGLPYPFFKPEIPIVIQTVKNSPAYNQGLRSGDKILEINSKKIQDVEDFMNEVVTDTDKPLNMLVLRNGQSISMNGIRMQAMKQPPRYIIGIYPKDKSAGLLAIRQVIAGSPAFNAGLKDNDIIRKINDSDIEGFADFVGRINETSGKEVTLTVTRDGRQATMKIKPELKESDMYYLDGIGIVFYNHINPWRQFVNVLDMSYKSLRGMFSKNSYVKAKHLSGPVGIVTAIGSMVAHGSLLQALNFIAIITFSLGLLNLLPLPVLDGGHIIHSVIEMIIRRPISNRILQPVYMTFIFLLIFLMILTTFNDVNRITNFTKYIPFIGKSSGTGDKK